MLKFIYLSFIFFMFHSPASAYLDPGTGAILLQAIVGIVAAFIFYIKRPKLLLERIKELFKKDKDKKKNKENL